MAIASWTCLCASTPIQITAFLSPEAKIARVGDDERRASLGSCDRLLSSQIVDADFAGRTTDPVKGSESAQQSMSQSVQQRHGHSDSRLGRDKLTRQTSASKAARTIRQ